MVSVWERLGAGGAGESAEEAERTSSEAEEGAGAMPWRPHGMDCSWS